MSQFLKRITVIAPSILIAALLPMKSFADVTVNYDSKQPTIEKSKPAAEKTKAPKEVDLPVAKDPWTGFYTGINFGGAFGDNHFGKELPSNDFQNKPYKNVDSDYWQYLGGLQLGYGHLFAQRYYLGAELGYQYKSSQPQQGYTTPRGTNYDFSLQNHNTFYLDLKPGFTITPNWLVYSRLGVELDTYKMKYSGNGYLGPKYPDGATFVDSSKTVFAPRLGLGTEYAITPSWSVSADYVHTFARSIDFVQQHQDFTGGGGTTKITMKPNRNTFTVGVNYHF